MHLAAHQRAYVSYHSHATLKILYGIMLIRRRNVRGHGPPPYIVSRHMLMKFFPPQRFVCFHPPLFGWGIAKKIISLIVGLQFFFVFFCFVELS